MLNLGLDDADDDYLMRVNLEELLEDDWLRQLNIDDIIFACTDMAFTDEDFLMCHEDMPEDADFNEPDSDTVSISSHTSYDDNLLMDVDDILALFKDD